VKKLKKEREFAASEVVQPENDVEVVLCFEKIDILREQSDVVCATLYVKEPPINIVKNDFRDETPPRPLNVSELKYNVRCGKLW
jgi:hypothetical protein